MTPPVEADNVSPPASPIDRAIFARAQRRVGSTLKEKWHLDYLLGVGGMAAVYAATHRNKGRAAVKLLHDEFFGNAEVRRRFLREGYAANSVEHPGVVRVLDDDVAEDGAPFLVTELLDGETLEARRVRLGGRLACDEVLVMADQVLDVLAMAHGKGILHRDLKPENLFLTRDGLVKILDFGIARVHEPGTGTLLTQSGAPIGTPAFMAPEQARGLWSDVDARSDLWAVGATMFALVTDDLVHHGRTASEMLLSAMTRPAPRLSSIAPALDPRFVEVVDRALAFERERRWPSATTMQEAVRRAYRGAGDEPGSSALRLTVPATVIGATLPSTPVHSPAFPTTGQPVSGDEATVAPSRRSGRLVAFSFLVCALGLAAVFLTRTHVRPLTAGSPTPTAVDAPSRIPSGPEPAPGLAPQASVAPSAPEVSIDDLPARPGPTAASAPSARSTRARPPTTATSASAPTKPSCTPPYEVDPKTGRKNWKVECL
jgi:eukaryotic-like serine/threonine-protein kinase